MVPKITVILRLHRIELAIQSTVNQFNFISTTNRNRNRNGNRNTNKNKKQKKCRNRGNQRTSRRLIKNKTINPTAVTMKSKLPPLPLFLPLFPLPPVLPHHLRLLPPRLLLSLLLTIIQLSQSLHFSLPLRLLFPPYPFPHLLHQTPLLFLLFLLIFNLIHPLVN